MSTIYTSKELDMIETANKFIANTCFIHEKDMWKMLSKENEIRDSAKYCYKICSRPNANCEMIDNPTLEQGLMTYHVGLTVNMIRSKKNQE